MVLMARDKRRTSVATLCSSDKASISLVQTKGREVCEN